MNVLLVTPGGTRFRERWMPLGLMYLASSLKAAGHRARVHDRYLLKAAERDEALRREILSFQPDMIGFSTVSPMIYDTIQAVRAARSCFDGPIVLGGHHATAMPVLTLDRIPEADFVLTGEGERTLTMLANGLAPGEIPGLWRREGERALRTPGSPRVEDLDSLNPPDYSQMDMAYYAGVNPYTIANFLLRSAPVLTSRGCFHHCEFCTESLAFSEEVRFHSAEYVLDVIAKLVKDARVNGIAFYDSDFLASREHAQALCEGLIRSGLSRKIRFSIQTRTDRIDDSLAVLLRRAGCVKAELGLETGREATLQKIGKNATTAMSERAVQCLNRAGVSVQANMILGLPGESIEDLNNTLDWMTRLSVDNIKCTVLFILPGSKMYRDLGGGFFENSEWTRENIRRYMRESIPSDVPREILAWWFEERYLPLAHRLERAGLLRHNSPGVLFCYAAAHAVRNLAQQESH